MGAGSPSGTCHNRRHIGWGHSVSLSPDITTYSQIYCKSCKDARNSIKLSQGWMDMRVMEMGHLVYPKSAVKVVKTQGSVLNHEIIPRMDRHQGHGNGTSDIPHQPLAEKQSPLREPSTVGDKHIQWNRIQP